MKKSKILVMLACMGLLLTACGGGNNPSTSVPGGDDSSGSEEESDEKYYALPFNADDPEAEPAKWEKGAEYKWTFDVKEDHVGMTFAFGAKMSSDSHSTRSLFTDHNGASSSDPFESNEANDGTPRITVTVNGAKQCLTRDTYGEAGLGTSELAYFKVATFGVKQGKVDVTLTTSADAGYRLFLGGEARLYYPKAEPTTVEGYNVTFAGEHCKVLVYPSKNYEGVTPTEATSTKTVLDSGAQSKYYPPTRNDDGTYEDDEVKPQVNFKVECDEGYKLDDNSIVISGAKGNEWNDLKAQGSNIYRITKIKADIDVTVVPVVDEGGEDIDAGEVTFALTNCTVKVYIGPKDETGSNVDAGPKFYSRNKTEPYDYFKGDNAQFNFEVVPNPGYKFVDETVYTDGEAKANLVSFITGSYNKLKLVDTNLYRLTKVTGDVAITLNCVAA